MKVIRIYSCGECPYCRSKTIRNSRRHTTRYCTLIKQYIKGSSIPVECTLAVALYIVKGNSVKSKKVETIKNKFSIVVDLNTINSFKYRVYFNNYLISSHATKEEAIEYINEVKKDYEGMEPDGTIYEEYIS